jgi:lysophospholipase L1-like esterase
MKPITLLATLLTLLTIVPFIDAADVAELDSSKLNPQVIEGLGICVTGPMQVTITPGKCTIDAKQVEIPQATVIDLARPGTVRYIGQKYLLKIQKPTRWYGGTKLSGCGDCVIPLPDCFMPRSIVIRSTDATKGPFEEGRDYLVDHGWGMVGRVAEGRIGENEKVAIDYSVSLRRIDTIQIGPDGQVSLIRGIPDKACPLPPKVATGSIALANLFFNYRVEQFTADDIFLIGPALPQATADQCKAKAALIPKTRKMLADGGELKIGFWGDSVTVGVDVDKKDSYVESFIRELKKACSNAKIDHFNAGIDGSSTAGRLPKFKEDVLDKKPDLVIIEFVNNMGFSPEKMQEDYKKSLDQIEATGAEVILVGPHFVMPSWMNSDTIRLTENRPAYFELAKIAKGRNVAFADTSRRWGHLQFEGIPYISLMANGINHPDARGHRLFVEELMQFFQP